MLNSNSTISKTPIYVAVAGNIGSGKSSFTTVLSHHFQCRAFYEIVETNPYLNDFYADMSRWSFQTQIYFLTKRFHSLQRILESKESIVQDRSIYEDAEVFARSLYLQGFMSERDYRTYCEHFEVLCEHIRTPDLMIYLRSDVSNLQDRIAKRGRPYERSMSSDYVSYLNERYEEWFQRYHRGPSIMIDVSKRDFLNRPEDLRTMISIVKWEIDRLQNPLQTQLPLRAKGLDLKPGADFKAPTPPSHLTEGRA